MKHSFYFDASALAKRYIPENGSPLVDEILNRVPRERSYVLIVGAAEVISVLVRKRNTGVLAAAAFGKVLLDFEAELFQSTINKLPVPNRLAASSFSLIIAHSINSADAITLKSARAVARKLRSQGDELILVASDQRLLRAAGTEGLGTFDPERQDQAALARLIGP